MPQLQADALADALQVQRPARSIQQALEKEGATPDELTAVLDLLHPDGCSADMPTDRVFLLMNAEDYTENLNKRQRNLIRAAQVAQGGDAGVLLNFRGRACQS